MATSSRPLGSGKEPPQLRIGVLAYPGCMPSQVLGIADVLKVGLQVAAATLLGPTPDLDVRVMSARPSLRLDVAGGGQLLGGPASVCDVLVVPGFNAGADEREIDSTLTTLRLERDFLQERFRDGTQLVSVCLGAFLLADAGVLDGRRATTSWLHAPFLRRRHPGTTVVDDHMVVRDRGVTTAAAYSAMFDLALQLISDLYGRRVAERTAAIMLLDATRERQTPYVDEELLAATGTSFGAAVQRWLRSNLHQPFDLSLTAAEFAVSPRTLNRRFADDTGTTPLKYVHSQRMHRAKHLLSSTTQSVAEVAQRVGYRDAATFTQLFKKQVGLTPRDYRARFAPRKSELEGRTATTTV